MPKGRPKRVLPPKLEAAMIADATSGVTVMQLAIRYGIGENTARRILARAGVVPASRQREPAAPTVPVARPELRSAYASIGSPPDDELESSRWMLRALAIAAHHAMTDENYEGDERARRAELRQLARAMTSVIPKARLLAAEDLVRADMAALETGYNPGPQYEDLPPAVDQLRAPRFRCPPAR